MKDKRKENGSGNSEELREHGKGDIGIQMRKTVEGFKRGITISG